MIEECKQKVSYGGFVWVIVAVVFLYVLSVGPAAMVAEKNGSSATAIRQFYAPVIWLHNHTVMKRPLEVYLDLWGAK